MITHPFEMPEWPLLEGPKSARDATILEARIDGDTLRKAGNEAGCSAATALAVERKHSDFVAIAKRKHTKKVLNGIERATGARLEDASTVESRTGAQSYRVLMESVGWIGRNGPLVAIDARQVHVTLDAGKSQALASLDAASSVHHLENRLSALRGETAELAPKAAVSSDSGDDDAVQAPDPGYDPASPPRST